MEKREELGGRIAAVEVELAEARAGLAEIELTTGRDVVDIRRSLAEQEGERRAVAAST